MNNEKPKAVIDFKGYEVCIDSTVQYRPTLDQAQKLAREWEAEKVAEWEVRNSEETKHAERARYFWTKMYYFVRELKVDAQQAGKAQQKERVQVIHEIRERIERIMKEAGE
jgi:hypothetical protein